MNLIKPLLYIITCSIIAQSSPLKLDSSLINRKKLAAIEQNIGQKVGALERTAATNLPAALQSGVQLSLTSDLPDSQEISLGRETAGRLLAAYPLVKNDSLQRYVNLVGTIVAQESGRPDLPWTFGVIESDDINAFAMPGGYITITTGLYRALCNEAELAGVLGHEIAHVNLRHHVRLMQKERLLARGRDYLAGQTNRDALRELAGKGAQIAARALDKNAEYESDRTGIEYAARAGYDPFAYLDVLDRMGASNQTDRLGLLFKTHPHPRDRLAALETSIGAKWSAVGGIVPKRWIRFR